MYLLFDALYSPAGAFLVHIPSASKPVAVSEAFDVEKNLEIKILSAGQRREQGGDLAGELSCDGRSAQPSIRRGM